MVAAALACVPGAAQAATITVDDDKLDCPNAAHVSVQAAVNAASPGDVVVICPGTYEEGPATVPAAGANAVTIHKMLTIRGAGADKVVIRPKPELTSLLGATTNARNGTGAVIGVARSGVRNLTDISGVTVEAGATAVGAGVKFWNSEGSLTASRIRSIAPLGAPQGYGAVVASNLVADRLAVRISGVQISGYSTAGVLLDSTQAAPALGVLVATIQANTITGAGPTAVAPQQGVLATGLVSGAISGNVIGGNQLDDGDPATVTDDPASAGVRLVDLDLTPVSPTNANTRLTATGNTIAGNGFGVRNETAAGDDRTYPFTATGNWWGDAAGPSLALPRTAGDPVNGAAVNYASARTTPITAPTVPGTFTDAPPAGAVDPPTADLVVRPGVAYTLAAVAADDFGVKSVGFRVAGEPLGTADTTAPYASTATWTPPAALDGQQVELSVSIVDSAGQVTTATLTVTVTAPPEEEPPPAEEEPAPKPADSAPVVPAPVVPVVEPADVKPTLGLGLRARKRQVTVHGRLSGCTPSAEVTVTLALAGKRFARRSVKVGADCRYTVTVKAPKRAKGRRITASARAGDVAAKARTLRLQR
jgi:hypothetical protein